MSFRKRIISRLYIASFDVREANKVISAPFT